MHLSLHIYVCVVCVRTYAYISLYITKSVVAFNVMGSAACGIIMSHICFVRIVTVLLISLQFYPLSLFQLPFIHSIPTTLTLYLYGLNWIGLEYILI